jgi:Putative peptidoglycan binding domain
MARPAECLDKLLAEINAIAPGRNKASDGWIGDDKHKQRKSDHNPDEHGVVHARDITHDAGNGADMTFIAEQLRVRRDPRTKYIIFNKRIASANTDWNWAKFTGDNPHTHHMHISVVADDSADDTSGWGLQKGGPPVDPNVKLIVDAPPFEPFDLDRGVKDPHRVRWLQAILEQRGWGKVAISGVFDDATANTVMVMQRDIGVDDDGRYGMHTAQALSTFLHNG